MKIHLLRSRAAVYSSIAYLVLGNDNRLDDVNSLVDVGTDGSIINTLGTIRTGVGKKQVDRVVLTHSHFDHSGGLGRVIHEYAPEVMAYAQIEGVGRRLTHGEIIVMGDEEFEVIHVPEHSSDSVCLYSAKSGTLFSGDTPLGIQSPGGSYQSGYVTFLEDLLTRDVKAIYSGHDAPNMKNPRDVIRETLKNVLASDVSRRPAI